MYYYYYEYFNKRPIVQFHLVAKEENVPTLLDVTTFLYDFNLAYEVSRLATDPEYEDLSLSRYAFYRNGRPLNHHDRLRVLRLHHESPVELVTGVAAVGGVVAAVWGVVQIVEKVSNFRLNREKLRLEVEKARREEQQATRKLVLSSEEEATARLRARGAMPLLNNIEKRMQIAKLKVAELEIHLVRSPDRQQPPEAEK